MIVDSAGASSDDMSIDLVVKPSTPKRPLSLAEALSRRGKVVAHTTPTSTPVATAWLKTASNAGTEGLSESELTADGEGEGYGAQQALAARLLDPDCEIDVDALNGVVRRFLRRDEKPPAAALALVPLPASWFACSIVARCLYEVKNRHFKYLVPLVDVVSLGVVSYRALRGFLSRLAVLLAADDKLSTTSITASLCHPEAMLAMESVMRRVADLPEADVVRCAQYAIRLRRAMVRSSGDPKTSAEWLQTLHVKTHRVLMRCVVAAVDMVKLGRALNAIPMNDVKELLNFFGQVLRTMRTRDVKLCGQEGSAPDNYRGVRGWLDEDLRTCHDDGERKELEGCMEWAGIVIDSHMASILLDCECNSIVSDLLERATEQREILDTMTPLVGALQHVERQLEVPDFQDRHLFTVTRMRVKASIHSE